MTEEESESEHREICQGVMVRMVRDAITALTVCSTLMHYSNFLCRKSIKSPDPQSPHSALHPNALFSSRGLRASVSVAKITYTIGWEIGFGERQPVYARGLAL